MHPLFKGGGGVTGNCFHSKSANSCGTGVPCDGCDLDGKVLTKEADKVEGLWDAVHEVFSLDKPKPKKAADLLEAYGVPYTGSDPVALALTLDKALTKRVW